MLALVSPIPYSPPAGTADRIGLPGVLGRNKTVIWLCLRRALVELARISVQ